MPVLSTYVTSTALVRIGRILLFTNILQTLGCVICVSVFILTTATSTSSSTNHSPFSFSIQITSLGSYLAIPIGSVALAFRKDPTEGSLLISQILSVLAIGIGVVPIIAIFQNYLDPTLPLFFTSGYLTNIPAFITRTIPLMYIWQRKRRGAPVGDWGNLNGIRIDMQNNKRARFILYLVFFGIMASFILTRLAFSSPDLIVWFPFVILFSVSMIGLVVYLQGGKSGWQPVILDTYENKTMWWYTAQGSLVSVLLKNPYVAFQGNLVKISLVKRGLPTNLRFHSQADLDHFLAITGLSGLTNNFHT